MRSLETHSIKQDQDAQLNNQQDWYKEIALKGNLLKEGEVVRSYMLLDWEKTHMIPQELHSSKGPESSCSSTLICFINRVTQYSCDNKFLLNWYTVCVILFVDQKLVCSHLGSYRLWDFIQATYINNLYPIKTSWCCATSKNQALCRYFIFAEHKISHEIILISIL